MAVNGKKKGNKFELDIAKRFSEHFGDTFKRVPSSGALTGGKNREQVTGLREDAKEILSGDLIVPAWFNYSVECKNYADDPKFHQLLEGKSLVMDEWIRQADEDAMYVGKQPLVVFKVNRKGTFAAFDVTLKDINYAGEPFMVYRHKIITTLDVFLNALGKSHYKDQEDDSQ